MAYIGQEPGQGQAQRSIFTAVAVTDTVTADDNSLPLNYTVGQVSVYLNGVKQVVGDDVVASNGSTLVFASDYAIGDVIEVIALDTFSVGTVEGTALISTGESGGSKFLREDGDGTSSWQVPSYTTNTDTIYNDDVIQTNIALLGFKVAVNGSLAKYDLQDQIVDEYTTNAGVNTGDSTNHNLTAGVYSGAVAKTTTQVGGTTGTHGTYTWYKWTATSGTRTFTTDFTVDFDYLVVAGGGSSGRGAGATGGNGGGGAGGFLTGTGLSIASQAYTITVGDGGVGFSGSNGKGRTGGASSIVGASAGSIKATVGGGGAGIGAAGLMEGLEGGSGGGSGAEPMANGGARTASPVQGNVGGAGPTSGGGGGGGAGAAGSASGNDQGGVGGAGENNVMGMNDADSDAFLTTLSVGHDSGGLRYFSGGGGGGSNANGSVAGGVGGGGASAATTGAEGTDGTDGTGGGGGGSGYASQNGADGGSGIVILRTLTSNLAAVIGNLTLQSTDTTAEAAPTKADMVILVEDAGSGVGTLDTTTGHIKGWVSMYETGSTKTWTQVPLVDEGHWEGGPTGGKRILAAHDVTLTGTSGTQMAYKITTHSASAVYDTKIHATSIGWR